jgi:serine/threonine-protein kinase RsbW
MPGLTKTGELVCLEVPALPGFVGVARSVVAAVASTLDGIDDDRLEDLRVAVSEACTNAVEALKHVDESERVIVRCTATEDSLDVCIENRGEAFDPDDLPAPDGSERGWGVQLIEALVDDVTFRRTAEGTAVDLVIRFDRTDAS